MAEDTPAEKPKRQVHPNSLGNLRPMKPGERTKNPEGKNGRHRAELVAAFLEEPSDADPSISRIRMVLMAMYKRALKASDVAGKALVEQYAGKAKQQIDVSSQGAQLRVLALLPDNGRGPGEAHVEDEGQASEGDEPERAEGNDPAGDDI